MHTEVLMTRPLTARLDLAPRSTTCRPGTLGASAGTMPKGKHLDRWSTATIVVTLILFLVALFEKGVTHDVLLEAAVFLVSVKLVLGSMKAQLASENLHSRLDAIQALLEAAAVGRADRSPPRAARVLRSEAHAEKG
jgi:hypothetical protein